MVVVLGGGDQGSNCDSGVVGLCSISSFFLFPIYCTNYFFPEYNYCCLDFSIYTFSPSPYPLSAQGYIYPCHEKYNACDTCVQPF